MGPGPMPYVARKTVKAIVVNIFSRKRPLYRIDEFYENMDTENLFGRGISLDDLTDYNLATPWTNFLSGVRMKFSPPFACGLSAGNRFL